MLTANCRKERVILGSCEISSVSSKDSVSRVNFFEPIRRSRRRINAKPPPKPRTSPLDHTTRTYPALLSTATGPLSNRAVISVPSLHARISSNSYSFQSRSPKTISNSWGVRMGCLYSSTSSIAIRGHAVLTQASTRYPSRNSGETRSMRKMLACRPCFSARELAGIGPASIRIADPHHVALLLEPFPDFREPVPVLRRGDKADPLRKERLRRIDEVHRGERRARQVVEEHVAIAQVRHWRVAEVDDQVDRHLGDIARSERGIRGHEAGDAGLGFEILGEFDRLRPQADGELESDGLGVSSSNDFEQTLRFRHGPGHRRESAEKAVPARPTVSSWDAQSRGAKESAVSRPLCGGPPSRRLRDPPSWRS